jgi:serine/threonine-protein kinase
MKNAQELVGERIDQYEILQHIARGGMADVYLAKDVDLQRQVALKVLIGALAVDRQFAQRFRREAQTVARLDHPNIVHIYSTGFAPGDRPYIAMQYIDGGSLRDRLKALAQRGKLVPTAQALQIVRRMAVALEVAHQAGIVHRDLKPANILLKQDGAPVLVDLGIAAVQGGARLTQTGSLLGTPAYMSPEQARGIPLDGRSDLYSLGVILYELLSGKRPFESEESIAILHKHVYEPPPPLEQIRPDLAYPVLQVVETALQKDPNDRFAGAQQMVAALDQAIVAEVGRRSVPKTTVWLPDPNDSDLISRRTVVQDTPPPSPRPGAKPTSLSPTATERGFNPWWAAAAMVALAAILGLFFLLRGNGAGDAVADGDLPTRVNITVTSPPPEEGAAIPTATTLPTLTPLPMATTAPAATDAPAAPTDAPPSSTAAPTQAELPQTMLGDDGRRMLLVPAGEFLMGSTEADVAAAVASCRGNADGDPCNFGEFNSEMPQHAVYLDAFYVDETEVSNDAYRACVNDGGCDPPDAGRGTYSRDSYYNNRSYGNYPVVYVSWYDARAYCAWAGKRLPTEAEWEKAARGEDGRIYPWGDAFQSERANTQDRGREAITPVGQYSNGASPYGALDMAGNVWEYVDDWFDPDYYQVAPDANPPGPDNSPSGDKVLRSGSYANFRYYARVANRGAIPPNSSTAFRGIRCVAPAP